MSNYRNHQKILKLKRRKQYRKYFIVPSWKVFLKNKQRFDVILQSLASLRMDNPPVPEHKDTAEWLNNSPLNGTDCIEFKFLGNSK